jgi:putative RNA 2'-phosphotransferase
MSARLVRISKLMSLILRHRPEQFGVILDPEGFTAIDDVVRAVRESMPDVNVDDLRRVVAEVEPDKSRFSIVGTDIRANYGHSLQDRIVQPRVDPPRVLLHGTSERVVPEIRRDGIRPMRRQYVHLTTSRDLAVRVGGRHGKATVLEVDALRASQAGLAFYRANESFWLADFIPAAFIRDIDPAPSAD